MSPDEVRQLLGLSRTYTYQLLWSGDLRSLRIGRLRKVRRSEVERFIRAREEEGTRG